MRLYNQFINYKSKKMLFIFLFFVASQGFGVWQAGDLNASWQCDDPQCPMFCGPVCEPLNCTTTCEEGFTCSQQANCKIECPYDANGILVSESCPTCSASCAPLVCQNCTATCEPIHCSWRCVLPQSCPPPTCVLVGQQAACVSLANSLRWSIVMLIIALLCVIIL